MPIKHYIDKKGQHYFIYDKSPKFYFNSHSTSDRKKAWDLARRYIARIKIKEKFTLKSLFD